MKPCLVVAAPCETPETSDGSKGGAVRGDVVETQANNPFQPFGVECVDAAPVTLTHASKDELV